MKELFSVNAGKIKILEQDMPVWAKPLAAVGLKKFKLVLIRPDKVLIIIAINIHLIELNEISFFEEALIDCSIFLSIGVVSYILNKLFLIFVRAMYKDLHKN